MATMDATHLPLMTRGQLLMDSITSINPTPLKNSLRSWSRKGIQQLQNYIKTEILSRWKDVQEMPKSVEDCLIQSLIKYREKMNWPDPKQKVMPSFEDAIFTLIYNTNVILSFPNKPVVFRFIEVGLHLIELVKSIIELDQVLGNFMSFEKIRNKISEGLKQIDDLMKKPANKEVHKSFKKSTIQRSYAALFSVVPKSTEIIVNIVTIICDGIPDNLLITDEEIKMWLGQMKEDKPIPEYILHLRFDHYFWNTSTVTMQIMYDEKVTKLKEQLEQKSKKIDDQEKEIMELNRLLEEKSKRNDDPGSSCEASDELCTLLQLGREQAKQANAETKFETNFSTSNFAYGVFDSKGGKLSVENGDVKLLIPDGALSSEKEIYIYVDPKARFSKLEDSSKDSSETRLAPIVQCGPPGTIFLSHVILTIPHNACDEEKWQFTPVRSDGGRRSTQNWKKIDETEDDDSIVIVDGGVCIFMIKHFTRFTVLREQNN